MSLWFFLWLILSGLLVYFLGWTLFIMYRQKQAWRSYASKKKLRYRSSGFTASPELSGPVEEYSVNIFTGEHMAPDARGSRKLTAVEVLLGSKMPISGGVSSGGMVEVIQDLGLQEEISPKHKDWDKSYIAAADNRAALDEYLTQERLDVLTKLMKVKNAWVIFVFKDDTVLLRFDTPDPFTSHKKLDAIIKRMIKAARILELNDGESARLKLAEAKKPQKQAALNVDDKDLETSGLELEDDADLGGDESVEKGDQESEEKPSTEKS